MNVFDFLAQDAVMRAYAPLFVALATLFGVAITLTVTERRARKTSRVQREDAYRDAMRKSLAKLLVNAEEFKRHGFVLSRPEYWVTLSFEKATEIANSAESTLRALNSSLVGAQLLAQEDRLLRDLDSMSISLNRACEVMHEVVDAFWEERKPEPFVYEREARWQEFAEKCDALRSTSRWMLRPTVRDEKRALSQG